MQEPIYSAQDEMEVMARLWTPALKNDPLKFVLYAFPWGVEGTELASEAGPREWQLNMLQDIGERLRAGLADDLRVPAAAALVVGV